MEFIVARSSVVYGVLPGLCHPDDDGFGYGDVRIVVDQVHLRPGGGGESEVGGYAGPRFVLYEDHPGFEASQRMNEGIQRVSSVLFTLQLLTDGWLAYRSIITGGVVRTP